MTDQYTFTVTDQPPAKRILTPAEQAARNLGGAVRRHAPPEELDRLRHVIELAKLESHIQKVMAKAPGISDQQAARLAALLYSRQAEPAS